jgi:hypothetical protein
MFSSSFLQFLRLDHHVLIGRVLVAADDRIGLHLAVGRAVFFVANALTAIAMELVEVDFFGCTDGWIRLDRHSD